MTNQHPSWAEAELEVAEKAWRAGHSASEIARKLPGRTRSAVIGIAHRRGWIQQTRAKPSTPAEPTPAPKPPRAPKVKAEVAKPRGAPKAPKPSPIKTAGGRIYTMPAPAAFTAGVHAAGPSAIRLIDRRRYQDCAWPVGTPERPAEQLCCGNPIPANGHKATPSYCADHQATALSAKQPARMVPSAPRERRAA